MTEARIIELMETKGFQSNNAEHTVFYCSRGALVLWRAEQTFRVKFQHPIKGWREVRIDFHNPVAAATYALRHGIYAPGLRHVVFAPGRVKEMR